MFKRALTVLCCTLLFATFSTRARADEWNKKTVVTFSTPVELPGIVLPAGTYVFKLADLAGERHVVQVFNKDESKIYATILAIPNVRLTPTGDTVLRFTERSKDLPDALKAWFYPGDNFGQEFVYPKTRAVTLAEESHAPVLAAPFTPEPKTEEMAKAPVETIAPPSPAVEAPEEHWTAPAPALEATEVTPTPAPAPELPKTASPLPLVALLGVALVSLGLLVKHVS